VILSSLKYMNLCRAGDIDNLCKWIIPDLEVAEMRGEITSETSDKRYEGPGQKYR